MLDAVLPIGVLLVMVLFVAQLRRLIEQTILNGTIRKALEKYPESVPSLVEKLGDRRTPDALVGWLAVVAGAALAVLAVIDDSADRLESLKFARLLLAVGAGILSYAWWATCKTPST